MPSQPWYGVVNGNSVPRVVVGLVRGRARFDVKHDPSRVFRVEAGNVTVEDLGTRFTLERITTGDEHVRVAVEAGRVLVVIE